MLLSLLLQFDWQKFRPENILGGQVLERTPAALSLIYLAGVLVLIVFLALSFIGNTRRVFNYERDLPKEILRKVGRTIANRNLRVWQVVFLLLAFSVYGFHVYWAVFAEKDNARFQELSGRDLRTRRSTVTQLRGWLLDRSGKLNNALAYYKKDTKDGGIDRFYPLDREMAHLFGTELGSPGLERTLFNVTDEALPEAWEIVTKVKKPEDDEKKDVVLTIDRELQSFAAKQLEGRKGAVVVLNPQTGDILAMYSNPSYALSEINSAEDMHRLENDKMNKPLLSRALREYYVPGSTFKTFTMITAFRNGAQNTTFTSSAGGFVPFRGSRSIHDANGGCEPPYGCTTLNIAQAFEASSNQYFSQMAATLGRERLGETARILGINAAETPFDAINSRYFPDILNTSAKRTASAIAPRQSAIVTGKKISQYDVALQGMGQGYAGEMTPFQMALIASTPANLQGKLMKPRVEINQPPQAFAQALSPQQAADIRDIMALVTEGSGGTATRVFGRVRAEGIRTGGKTGTAEKDSPVFDPKTGKLKTIKKHRRDKNGKRVEYDAPVMYSRTDSWFICFSPLENPQLAIAVVVEGGGFGATIAAPIAANIVLKARDLGLLGPNYKPKAVAPTSTPKRRNR